MNRNEVSKLVRELMEKIPKLKQLEGDAYFDINDYITNSITYAMDCVTDDGCVLTYKLVDRIN